MTLSRIGSRSDIPKRLYGLGGETEAGEGRGDVPWTGERSRDIRKGELSATNRKSLTKEFVRYDPATKMTGEIPRREKGGVQKAILGERKRSAHKGPRDEESRLSGRSEGRPGGPHTIERMG